MYGGKNKKAVNKHVVIPVCIVAIVVIIAINVSLPKQIKFDQNVTEFTVRRGKDGQTRKVYDDDKKIISKLDGMKLKSYSIVSRLKGDTLRSGWVYRISYNEADGEKKSIVVSPGEVEYKGKRYKTKDTALNDIIDELDRIFAE